MRSIPRESSYKISEESCHYYEWENVYKTKARDELILELQRQEKENYPWKNGSVKERHRLAALCDEIRERGEALSLSRFSRFLKNKYIASLLGVFDRL